MTPHPSRSPRPALSDIAEALALLSRLPVRASGTRGAAAAWAWPVAGAVLGALAGLLGALALALGLPAPLAAGLALGCGIVTTGALHEDGLADAADGLWGGWTPERRLEIMKDSRIGSYGVIALILGLGLRWSALAALFGAGHALAPLICAGALSRAPMAVLAARLPNARPGGLSAATGRPGAGTETRAILAALLLGLVTAGAGLIPAALAAGAATALAGRLALSRIGGQTGDILGATQQLAEVAVLATLAALLA